MVEFPAPPFASSALLTPLVSLIELRLDCVRMRISLDDVWIRDVVDEIAYFYSWRGRPSATLLVVHSENEIFWLELQGSGERRLTLKETTPILNEAHRLIRLAGLRFRGELTAIRH